MNVFEDGNDVIMHYFPHCGFGGSWLNLFGLSMGVTLIVIPFGLNSQLSLPLIHKYKVIGTFNLFSGVKSKAMGMKLKVQPCLWYTNRCFCTHASSYCFEMNCFWPSLIA